MDKIDDFWTCPHCRPFRFAQVKMRAAIMTKVRFAAVNAVSEKGIEQEARA